MHSLFAVVEFLVLSLSDTFGIILWLCQEKILVLGSSPFALT